MELSPKNWRIGFMRSIVGDSNSIAKSKKLGISLAGYLILAISEIRYPPTCHMEDFQVRVFWSSSTLLFRLAWTESAARFYSAGSVRENAKEARSSIEKRVKYIRVQRSQGITYKELYILFPYHKLHVMVSGSHYSLHSVACWHQTMRRQQYHLHRERWHRIP